MNCDQVFQHLASANPASVNGALERHLNSCAACRQMAELFRPAVHLLAAEPPEDSELPGETGHRWPQVWEAVTLAERTAAQLDVHVRQAVNRQTRPGRLLRMAGVLILGIVLGVACSHTQWLLSRPDGTKAQVVGAQNSMHQTLECRFDRLLDREIQGGLGEFCSDCRPKVESDLSSIVALCMVCHVRPTENTPPRATHASVLE